MQKRKLGKSNLEVSALGLGCIELTPDDLRDINNDATFKITVQGARYSEKLEQMTGR